VNTLGKLHRLFVLPVSTVGIMPLLYLRSVVRVTAVKGCWVLSCSDSKSQLAAQIGRTSQLLLGKVRRES